MNLSITSRDLGESIRRQLAAENIGCSWFAACPNLATGFLDAGPLGNVAICGRCLVKATGHPRRYFDDTAVCVRCDEDLTLEPNGGGLEIWTHDATGETVCGDADPEDETAPEAKPQLKVR